MGNLWMNVTCSMVAVLAVLFALKPGGIWEFANIAKSLTPSNSSLWSLSWKGEAEDCTCQVGKCVSGLRFA